MHNRIAIGTVQFGLDYGISNEGGAVTAFEIEKILTLASESGIQMLDTARAYGDSEDKLGQAGVEDFAVVTKLLDISKPEEDLKDSLEKLGLSSVYGLMLHDFSKIETDPEGFENLKRLKEQGLFQKLGFSLNRLSDLDFLLERNVDFDLVQLPFNLFDRRFVQHFAKLNEMGVEIHARSAFLQGLFFLDTGVISEYLQPLVGNLEILDSLAHEHELSKSSLALNYVLLNDYISKVVIGVTSAVQLQENLDTLADVDKVKELKEKLDELASNDEDLVLPMNWK